MASLMRFPASCTALPCVQQPEMSGTFAMYVLSLLFLVVYIWGSGLV